MWALGYEGHFSSIVLMFKKESGFFLLENILKFVLILKKQLPTL